MRAKSDNPVRRKELTRLTQADDRTVRLALETLRHNGEVIIAAEKGGYYYAETEAQYRKFRQSINARIRSQSEMLRAMEEGWKRRNDLL